MISEEDRQELCGELANAVYMFFRKKELLLGVAGDRKAAKDCTKLLGRVVAAAAYAEPIDSQYLLYVKGWEKKAVDITKSAAGQVVSGSIKSI